MYLSVRHHTQCPERIPRNLRLLMKLTSFLISDFKFTRKFSKEMAERKKKRYSSADDDEEELDTSEAIKFSQAGSIKRLKFINFMQYTEVEFQCGPNLNVIIGK